MPVRVAINVLNQEEVVRVVKDRTKISNRQAERIGQEIVKGLRGPDSLWPKKGGGVRGGASGASRVRFAAYVRTRPGGTNPVSISLTNQSTGRDRNRALGRRGGGSKRYAKWPEQGIPNKATKNRATKTVRKILPKVLTRVLGKGWDVKMKGSG